MRPRMIHNILACQILIAMGASSQVFARSDETSESTQWELSSRNGSVESAYVRFMGSRLLTNLYSLALSENAQVTNAAGTNFDTRVNLGGTVIETTSDDAHGQPIKSVERRSSIGFTETINKLTSFGATFGVTAIEKTSYWRSLRVGHWWHKSTIGTDFEWMTLNSNKVSRDYLDTDGLRVVTPANVKGNRYTLALTWLASTRALILAKITQHEAQDRPIAYSDSLEGRYFFDGTLTAVHVKFGTYQDMRMVHKNTDYGQVQAKEWEVQIHQHMSDQIIGTLVARDHFETENVRSEESPDIHRHSRSGQGRLRYRFTDGPVTDQVSELYVFHGTYRSYDSSKVVNHFGVGGSLVY